MSKAGKWWRDYERECAEWSAGEWDRLFNGTDDGIKVHIRDLSKPGTFTVSAAPPSSATSDSSDL